MANAKKTKGGKRRNSRKVNPIKRIGSAISNLCTHIVEGAKARALPALAIVLVEIIAGVTFYIGSNIYSPAKELRVASAKMHEIQYQAAVGNTESLEETTKIYNEVVKSYVESGNPIVEGYAKTYSKDSQSFFRALIWIGIALPFVALGIAAVVGRMKFVKAFFSIPVLLVFGLVFLLKPKKEQKSSETSLPAPVEE